MRESRAVVFGAMMLVAMFQGGCDGCSGEEYYCDDTGCFWCDSYGCRPVDPPDPVLCRGDWECPADLPVCTEAGCTAQCEVDGDCVAGLRCTSGFCVEPGTITPPDVHSGYCDDVSDCAEGERCAPSHYCMPDGSCYADVDCDVGERCDTADHVCETIPVSDGGTDDGGTVPDGSTDGPPIPEPQCHNNGECSDHYLCIEGVCMLPCSLDSECGAGCHCIGGFCSAPET